MPFITSLNQGRHRFQIGSGLYTTSDAQRGTTVTPSQAARGLSPDDPTDRWFALDQATKQAWQAVAQLGMSGRKCYTVVNRLRYNANLATVAEPPDPPYLPVAVTISNVRATIAGVLPGFPTYLFASSAALAFQEVELALYKAAVGSPSSGGTGARWLIVGSFPLSGSTEPDNEMPMGGTQRGPGFIYHPVPVPPAGTAIKLRFIVNSTTYYPDNPQYFDLTVQP